MKLFKSLSRMWTGDAIALDEKHLLDHLAIKDSASDWRDARLLEAAKKLGRPFKCGPASVEREVLIAGSVLTTLKAGEKPRPLATVTELASRRKTP